MNEHKKRGSGVGANQKETEIEACDTSVHSVGEPVAKDRTYALVNIIETAHDISFDEKILDNMPKNIFPYIGDLKPYRRILLKK